MIDWEKVAQDHDLDRMDLMREVMIAAMSLGVYIMDEAKEPEFVCTIDGDRVLKDYELVVQKRTPRPEGENASC